MSTEIRFLLAVVLMIGVLVITNLLFPPELPEELPGPEPPDSALVQGEDPAGGVAELLEQARPQAELAAGETQEENPLANVLGEPEAEEPEVAVGGGQAILVEGPLYAYSFSSLGARMIGAQLPNFPSFALGGPVELLYPGGGAALGTRLLVESDTADMRGIVFEVEPETGLRLEEGGGPESLRFTYRLAERGISFEVTYTFHPDSYLVEVTNQITGLDVDWVLTDMGQGIPFNEQKDRDELRAAAYVVNHQQEGISSVLLSRVQEQRIEEGPLIWTVLKSKYFMLALIAGSSEEEGEFLGGAVATPTGAENQASVSVSQQVSEQGTVRYRFYAGHQECPRLEAIGSGLKDANPYGWKFMRPIVRPFAGIIIRILSFLHENLHIGYGWVLILFGIMMRIVLFPLNQKGMKAQMRNMAAQPLMQEIQTKYKDNPEKLQKEMMKLYKEHGFNPLAGCLPMLLPWPVLIALFFVFQNTIELRGVSFLWLPDLSAPDPYFILPVFLGISMFLLQWVSMRSMPQQNPQMKMMMYVMPIMMVFIFFQLASGLNLYYATANIATLPQQIWIAGERKKAAAKPPLTLSS
jgi:YidC/Oxa1 family membrane protein insertase